MEKVSNKINICSLLGITVPLIGAFVLLILGMMIEKLLFLWVVLTMIISIAGIILSVIGLALRNSKYNGSGIWDAILGIIVSTIILVCLFIIVKPEDFKRYSRNSHYDDYYEEDDDYDDYDDDDDEYSYSSKKDVIVKDFSSMTKEEINKWCKDNNIICIVLDVYSDTIEKGKFIKQSIKSNEVIKEEGLIRIDFSKGKRAEFTKEELVKKAESYSRNLNISKKKLYNQLTSEYGDAFTEEEANYAIEQANIDWKKNALEQAKIYKKKKMLNYDIYTKLSSAGGDQFTEEEAEYAVNHLED